MCGDGSQSQLKVSSPPPNTPMMADEEETPVSLKEPQKELTEDKPQLDVEQPHVFNKSDEDDDEEPSCMFLTICIGLMVLVGTTLTAVGYGHVMPPEPTYVCGPNPPSVQDLEARANLPVCMASSPSGYLEQQPLCLRAADEGKPPEWCYKDVLDGGSFALEWSYYLWWSDCEECGKAWRMGSTKVDKYGDVTSYYKLEMDSPPGPADVPPDSSQNKSHDWLVWDNYLKQWNATDQVSFFDCPRVNLTENGIPQACFAERQGKMLQVMGGIGSFILFISLVAAIGNFCPWLVSWIPTCGRSYGGGGGGGGGGC